MPTNAPLPPKENALFKRILKCYEHKQYKNSLKFAKQILSNPRFTDHGETLAMKGLTLNCLGRKEEAYEHVRRGLKNDLKSHICWHVYGLLQRSDKKYDEAIKCYRNALKCDKDNIQILRDLSLLQIQMRDLEGYRDTRYQLFVLRPTQRASWIGYAMAYHLLKDYDMALKILEEFRKTQQKTPYDYEHSELLLYQNMVIREADQYSEAWTHLLTYGDQICDRVSLLEIRAELCLKLEYYKDAEVHYRELLRRNPENQAYCKGLEEARRLAYGEDKVDLYYALQMLYSKSLTMKRIPLDHAKGSTFRILIDQYLRDSLRKGVPPLFVDLRPLYKDRYKVEVIEELVVSYARSLESVGLFPTPNGLSQNHLDTFGREPATALLWTYYLLAQHYDYLQDTEKALKYVELGMEHTPTLIELFVVKARIYKHAGDIQSAVKCLVDAQALDTADRYINSKCAKYMLRANMIQDAEEMCSKFTREGVPAMENLNEMQCMWFQTECALSYQRLGRFGDALKKCHEIERHFSEILEDQFDFHTYCLRRMTLRAYMGLLRLEDVLRSHPFFFKAAKSAIEVYIALHDNPSAANHLSSALDTEDMTDGEKKKMRNKQRKAQRKAEVEKERQNAALEKKEQHNKAKQQQDGETDVFKEEELIPEKLAKVEDPLEQAGRFLKPLQMLATDRIETHLLAFEVYYRKGKLLLMLQCISRALQVNGDHPRVHSCLVRFFLAVSERQNLDETLKVVLQLEMKKIYDQRSPQQLNTEFLRHNRNSLPHLFEGAKVMALLDKSRTEEALNLFIDLRNGLEGVTLNECTRIYNTLCDNIFGSCSSSIHSFVAHCQKRYPYSTVFSSPMPLPGVLQKDKNCLGKNNFLNSTGRVVSGY